MVTCVSLCACAVSSGRDPDLTATAAAGTRRPERFQCRHHPEQRSGAQAARARGWIAAFEGHPTLLFPTVCTSLVDQWRSAGRLAAEEEGHPLWMEVPLLRGLQGARGVLRGPGIAIACILLEGMHYLVH